MGGTPISFLLLLDSTNHFLAPSPKFEFRNSGYESGWVRKCTSPDPNCGSGNFEHTSKRSINTLLNINNDIYTIKFNLVLRMCVLFYSSFVCISAYANVYFKSILQKCLPAGLLSGFPSTAPPPVCVSAAVGTLAVWIPNQKKKKTGRLAQTHVRSH